jgi:hypothetical protein
MVEDREAGARRGLTSEAATRALSKICSTTCADLTSQLPHHYSIFARLEAMNHPGFREGDGNWHLLGPLVVRSMVTHVSQSTWRIVAESSRTFPLLRALRLPFLENHDSLLMPCNPTTVRCDSHWSSSSCIPRHLTPKVVQPPIKYVTSAEIHTKGLRKKCPIE